MTEPPAIHRISVVIPVYRGATTLPTLVPEILRFAEIHSTKREDRYAITEILLVHDCGPDDSDVVIAQLAAVYPLVKPVWLSRNFGQHPATLAGMASATGDWVVTMDEDGQHNPASIADLLDVALSGHQVVYAQPTNPPPHGCIRNALSRTGKGVAAILIGNPAVRSFNSFRIIEGGIARSLAAYCGCGVFIDVALLWITNPAGRCPVELRREMNRPSGYTLTRLARHFWQLILTSGTKPMRLIVLVGLLVLAGTLAALSAVLWIIVVQRSSIAAWAWMLIAASLSLGCVLTAIGVVAEYLAVTMTIAMGKPLYLVVQNPAPHRARRPQK